MFVNSLHRFILVFQLAEERPFINMHFKAIYNSCPLNIRTHLLYGLLYYTVWYLALIGQSVPLEIDGKYKNKLIQLRQTYTLSSQPSRYSTSDVFFKSYTLSFLKSSYHSQCPNFIVPTLMLFRSKADGTSM